MTSRKKAELRTILPSLHHLDGDGFLMVAGPCVVENREITMEVAERLVTICEHHKLPFLFKASYRKANRTRLDSFTGIGDDKAIRVLEEVRKQFNVPVITDIHAPEEARWAADFVDVLQVPAFLSRQTELLVACGETGKAVSVKKGQFLSPGAMKFAVDKIVSTGNKKVLITERGTTFGYNDLVVDFRGIPQMQEFGYPVIVDVTHSLQKPNQESGITGGSPAMIETMARAAVAVGSDGIFLETHPDPPSAKSDGSNMLPLDHMENLVRNLTRIRKAIIKS